MRVSAYVDGEPCGTQYTWGKWGIPTTNKVANTLQEIETALKCCKNLKRRFHQREKEKTLMKVRHSCPKQVNPRLSNLSFKWCKKVMLSYMGSQDA